MRALLKLSAPASPRGCEVAADSDAQKTALGDLQTLGAIVSKWCTPSGVRKGSKTKPLPESLHAIFNRLAAGAEDGYAGAAELIEDLDRAGIDIPPNAEAWERLLRHVRDHAAPVTLRKSA